MITVAPAGEIVQRPGVLSGVRPYIFVVVRRPSRAPCYDTGHVTSFCAPGEHG